MRAVFGLISLLLVLAAVMWNAKHALNVATQPAVQAASGVPGLPQGTPQQQVDAVGKQVQDAIHQGAAARASELE
jgi:hypothetical protein